MCRPPREQGSLFFPNHLEDEPLGRRERTDAWAALGGQMGRRKGCFGRLEGTYGDSCRGGQNGEAGI